MGPRHGALLFTEAIKIGRYDDEQREAVRAADDRGLVHGRLLSSWGCAIGKLLADQYLDGQRGRQREVMATALGDSLVRNPDALAALVKCFIEQPKEQVVDSGHTEVSGDLGGSAGD